MQLRSAQLASHLARGLAPLYVIHGDEPLLAIEAGDEIRAAARAAGFDEREILVAEPGFKWDAFAAANRNLGLLAARQEVEKLGLLLPEGELDHDAVERAIADVARFDVFQLSEAWLAGDPPRALRILAALEAEGEGVPLIVWQLGEDLHALFAVLATVAGGASAGAAGQATRVWGK